MPGDYAARPHACRHAPKQHSTAARVTSHQRRRPGVTAVCLSASTDRRPEGGDELHAPTRKLNAIHYEDCWSAILGLRWWVQEQTRPLGWRVLFSCRRGESTVTSRRPQHAATGKHALAWLQRRGEPLLRCSKAELADLSHQSPHR